MITTERDKLRHNAETALIQALALLRGGKDADALELTLIAVGRIGALIPEATLQRVSRGIADRITEAKEPAPVV